MPKSPPNTLFLLPTTEDFSSPLSSLLSFLLFLHSFLLPLAFLLNTPTDDVTVRKEKTTIFRFRCEPTFQVPNQLFFSV